MNRWRYLYAFMPTSHIHIPHHILHLVTL